ASWPPHWSPWRSTSRPRSRPRRTRSWINGLGRARRASLRMPERNSPTVAVSRMRSHWLAETIRLRESLWGPLEDGSETRRARAAGGTFADRLLYRAQLLGGREKLDTVLDRWMAMAHLSLFIMAV